MERLGNLLLDTPAATEYALAFVILMLCLAVVVGLCSMRQPWERK